MSDLGFLLLGGVLIWLLFAALVTPLLYQLLLPLVTKVMKSYKSVEEIE